ncbi:hypothetical protein EV361DRAFT_41971 [Lentinula raphanica]|nr:hypothetical protein EV361DRAFT_41971 [Lentinula raphanica]
MTYTCFFDAITRERSAPLKNLAAQIIGSTLPYNACAESLAHFSSSQKLFTFLLKRIQRILSRAGNQDQRTLNSNSLLSSQTSSTNSSFMFSPLSILAPGCPGASSDEPRTSKSRTVTETHQTNNLEHNILDPLQLFFSLPVTDTAQRPHQAELPNTSEQHSAPWKAQKDRVIANNNLRPNVRAAKRLNIWTSSFAQNQSSSNSLRYPKHILTAAQSLIADSWADQIKSTYGAGLLRWHQFCDGENIPDEMRMPAPEILITGFVASHAGSVTGSTIRSWLSGIRAWHIINQAPWPENSELLALARRSANVKGSHLRRTQRNPITLQHLLALRSSGKPQP